MKQQATLILLLLLGFGARGQQSQEGIASYYANRFHGKRTASGEIYDMNELTAAHRSLPFGTLLRVTRKDNGKSVLVRVNDRGPFSRGRLIDLSRKAAEELGMLQVGKERVSIEIVEEEPVVRIPMEAVATRIALQEVMALDYLLDHLKVLPVLKRKFPESWTFSKDRLPNGMLRKLFEGIFPGG